jgi:hypothetical protein
MNWVGERFGALGIELVNLTRDGLIARACKQTGLVDFGDDGFIEGLDRVVDAIHREAEPTLLGKLIAQRDLVSNLVVRLQLVDWRKRHPEVAEEEIRRPLFINGLPRTGTTFLFGLLAVDPAMRAPMSWEVDSPIPPARPETWTSDPRIKEVQKKFDSFNRLCPGLEAVHPLGARLPQECVVIFARNFTSEQFATLFDVPSYVTWIDDIPFAGTYDWHKRYLQHLQSGGVRGERWLLKSPCHLHLLDNIFETYPDANIIHTHRNPIDVIASVSSLFAMLRGISSDRVDRAYIGQQQLDWWEKLLAIALQQRHRHTDKSQQLIDIKMSEVVGDPLDVVERIYDHFGFELGREVRADMERFIIQNRRERHGSHTFAVEDFGIDQQRDAHRFAAYCERFGV